MGGNGGMGNGAHMMGSTGTTYSVRWGGDVTDTADPGELLRLQHWLEVRGMWATGHLVNHLRFWLQRLAR